MSTNGTRLLAKEQPHHQRAFEHYYGLGEQRSYERVAAEVRVAPSTVKLWARSFGWRERLRERDLEVAREVAGRTLTDEVSRRERSLQIVHLAMVQLAKAIAEGEVKMTLADLDKLIRLEAFLSDEPESRHEVLMNDLRDRSDTELREMVRREVDILQAIMTVDGAVEPRKDDASKIWTLGKVSVDDKIRVRISFYSSGETPKRLHPTDFR